MVLDPSGVEGEGLVLKKLALILEGEVDIPSRMRISYLFIRSAGGPTSARPHFIVEFGHRSSDRTLRVKVAKGSDKSRFVLSPMKDPDRFDIKDRETGDLFLGGVRLVPAIMHGPDMAFINLDPTCPLGCVFCTAGEERPLNWPLDRWVRVVLEANAKALERDGRPLGSVAITAGMPEGPENMLERMVKVVEGVRERLPEVPIGVEPNALSKEGLERLKAAGADELKVNVQASNPVIFRKVCPGLDWDEILKSLEDGVEVFGRNRVSSNIIIGLGETEDDIVRTLLALARMGVAANIRVLRVNQVNREPLEKVLGPDIGIKDPDRILRLVEAQKIIFEENGLDPGKFRTMCHRCGCCDLTLGVDL